MDCKEKVTGFVLDGDNKNPHILQQDDFSPPLSKNPNHLALSFNRYLNKKLSENKKIIVGISDCFRNLREKIKKWYSFLIHSLLDVETKKEAWLNTVSHLLFWKTIEFASWIQAKWKTFNSHRRWKNNSIWENQRIP